VLYIDYNWDLHPDRIVLDEELNIDKLGWLAGDLFKVTNVNGKAMLVKLGNTEEFLLKGIVDENKL